MADVGVDELWELPEDIYHRIEVVNSEIFYYPDIPGPTWPSRYPLGHEGKHIPDAPFSHELFHTDEAGIKPCYEANG